MLGLLAGRVIDWVLFVIDWVLFVIDWVLFNLRLGVTLKGRLITVC